MFGTALCGSTLWGGRQGAGLAAEPITPPPLTGLHILIGPGGGIDFTDALMMPSLNISDAINSRGSATFALFDADAAFVIAVGSAVRIVNNTTLLFSGTVDEVEYQFVGRGLGKELIHSVSCVDWNQLCDRHLLAARYDTFNQTLKQVLTAILTVDSGDIGETLADDGVQLDPRMPDGPVLGTLNFDYVPVTDALDELGQLTGYFWKIRSVGFNPATGSETRYLQFFEYAFLQAPLTVGGGYWEEYTDLKVTVGQDKYRNIQVLRGGKTATGVLTEQFKGDGETKTFTLSMPVAREMKPEIWIDTGGGWAQVSPSYVTLRGRSYLDVDQWTYAISNNTISQLEDETALAATHVLRVVYRGEYQLKVEGRADKEISFRAGIEGTSGTFSDYQTDDKIDSEELAIERMQGLLRRFARTPKKISFETDTDGFQSGQAAFMRLPELNIDGWHLIESVSFQSLSDQLFRYRVNVIEGEFDGGWAGWYRRLAAATKAPSARENDNLMLVRQRTSGIGIGDSQSLTSALYTWPNDAYTVALVNSTYLVIAHARVGTGTALEMEGAKIGWPA